jgi:hypothetical protein
MSNANITTFKNERNKSFIKDCHFIMPLNIIFLFDHVWNQLSHNDTKRMWLKQNWMNHWDTQLKKKTKICNIIRAMDISAWIIVVSNNSMKTNFSKESINDYWSMMRKWSHACSRILRKKAIERAYHWEISMDTITDSMFTTILNEISKTNLIQIVGIIILIDESKKMNIQQQLTRWYSFVHW